MIRLLLNRAPIKRRRQQKGGGEPRRRGTVYGLACPEPLEGRRLLAGVVLPNLPAGSKYQIAFVTAGTRMAESTDISTYNAYVTNEAGFSQSLPATTWRAWASTAATNASDNAPTYSDVPIYNTRGQVIAANSADFLYPIHRATQAFDQYGIPANRPVWTGSDYRGVGILNKTLGRDRSQWGDASNFTDSLGWVSVGEDWSGGFARSMYAISSVITVGGATTTPSAPNGLVAVPSNGVVALSWTAPSSTGDSAIRDYKIQFSSDGITWSDFARPTSNFTSATVTGLTNGVSYVFRVTAVNHAGAGAFTVPTQPVVPQSPSNSTTGVVLPNLPAGSKYQIAFVTAGTRMAESTDIVTYNAYVTNEAGFSQSLPATTWRAWASTATTNASDNARTYSDIPIYNTRGQLIATNSLEFLFPIHRATQAFDQYGIPANRPVWTGSDYRGVGILNKTLGRDRSQWGDATNYTDSLGWVSVGEDWSGGFARSMYAISSVITVGGATTAPSAPSGLVAVPGSGSVALSWNAPSTAGDSAIKDYSIQFSTDGSSWSDFAHVASNSTSATVAGLTNGASYVFRVAAVNTAGVGAFTVPTQPVVPRTVADTPLNLVGRPGNRIVTLTWSAPASNGGAAITDYIIQYKTTTASSWTTFSDGISVAKSATVTGLTSVPYVFRVATVNAAGTGAFSVPTQPITPWTLPDAPINLSGSPGNGRVSLSWSRPPSASESAIVDYRIQFSTDGINWRNFSRPTPGIPTSTSATVTGLTNGTPYVFRVAAVSLAGTGAFTAPTLPVTPRTTPGIPSNLVARPGNGSASLTWTAPTSNNGAVVTDYVIQYKTRTASSWTTLNDRVSTSTVAFIAGLANGTQYLFRVAAVNVAGTGAYTASPVLATPVQTQDSVVGRWRWFKGENHEFLADGQVITYSADGAVTYRADASWRKQDGNTRGYVFTWGSGQYRETLLLSADGKQLQGYNQYGIYVTYRKGPGYVVVPA